MKALRIVLVAALLSALAVFLVTNSLSKPAGAPKATSPSHLPLTSLITASSVQTPALPQSKEHRGRTVRFRGGRSPIDCLTDGQPASAPFPPHSHDSTVTRLPKLEKVGDVVRVVRDQPAPARAQAHRRRPAGHLDQGNDNCPATVISALPYLDSGTVSGMHSNVGQTCSYYPNSPDVLYQYTPTQTALYGISLSAENQETGLSLRTGGNCPGSSELACIYGPRGYPASIARRLTAGTTYYLVAKVDTSEHGGIYSLAMTMAGECNPDFSLTAPGSVSGNTCLAGDDCPLAPGDDQLVAVTIPHDGQWMFSMCDGQSWYARLFLSANCCSDTALTSDYYHCNYDRPKIGPRFLAAGTYYLDIEGYYEDECGAWTLTVEDRSCLVRPPNDNCADAGPAVSLPATLTGNNSCATRDCDSLQFAETWHSFQVDAVSDIEIDNCDFESPLWELYAVLATGCPCTGHPLIRADNYSNYNYCRSGTGYMLLFRNLQPGIYYYPVMRDSANGSEGDYSINVRAWPVCHVESQPGDVIECPESPEQLREGVDCDGGCYMGSTFQQINLGETVYGKSFSYLTHYGYRDTDGDWYVFDLPDTGRITVSVQAEFPVWAGIYDADCNYQTCYMYDYNTVACDTLSFTTTALRPHRFALLIQAYQYYEPYDSLHYRVTITEEHCPWPVVITPQAGDIPEGEPICYDGYNDRFNSGCDNSPEIYERISSGNVILGNCGVYHTNNGYPLRDADYYKFYNSGPSRVTVSVVAEFSVYLMVTDYCPGCDRGWAEVYGDPGDTVRAILSCEPAESLIVAIFPTDWAYLPCGTPYRMWVNCDPCQPCTNLHQPGDIVENEPPCSTYYYDHYDHFNGGCSSNPPAFGPDLHCGQAVWGKSGTYSSNGHSARDADWMRLILTDSQTPELNVVAQFPVMAAIVGPGANGGCGDVQLYSDILTAEPCDTLHIPALNPLNAGTYWLVVQPNVFTGVICGAEYHAWVTCGACVPNVVTDLTVQQANDDMVLNWSAQPGFAGTYTVYRSNVCAPWPDDSWQAVAQSVAPTGGMSDTYVDTNAAAGGDRRFYTVVRVCP